ncbi:nuclear pore complex protein Nup153 isoform A [Alligator mississippiensis]|uniref:Nuclear pore complex protein Nup153 n=1 Tax=Alligator mississippiensis TaxID=8496 RepID=A0A151N0Y2_ALLMI|nr:nuclear pore complex protein Nup153 isoform A [Alligator mississippiensis]
MASGSGGGKIRTRRYHLGASTPYSRGKQGIISRVTESVKNIVPGWLQKYFNKSEEEHVDTSEPRNQVENPLSYHHDYTEEDTTVIDGRVTPESTRIILEEPSTSRSALNFSDVLTRPSLHRSHLNCTMLDSTAPHCQPSTSSALGIGSSGLSLVKEIKDSTSQHDDDNISTTSGFSSRASDKEAERSHSLSQHTPTSSKKPAFNLTAFGALSPSLGNTSVLKTSQLGDSPFYPGKTTYGGAAAAARQSKARITPYQMPVRRQMKAKQANVQSYGVTSSTARRILQSLEKMSSPLADAKRIPSSVSSPHCSPVDRSVLDITGFHSKRKRVESQLPPVQKLVTPKTVSLSMSRSQYFKPSLTPTAESGKARQRVDIKHKGMREKNLAIELRTEPPESNSTYPKFSSPASNGLSSGGGGGGGKMRRERGLHYISKPGQEQEVEEPVLPKISLPISTMSLPQFSFGSLAATTTVSSSSITPTQPVINKVLPASNDSSPVFRFSSPIVKSTEAEVLPPLSIGFTFSVPVVKSTEPSGSSDSPMPHLFSPGTTTLNSTSNKKKGNDEYDGPFKPAKVLKEGSVLDVLKGPGFTSLKAHSLAAEQPVTTSTVVYTRPAISSFSAEDSKCVACQSEKPGGSVPVTSSSTSSFSVPSGGFMGLDKFKKPEGSWDCDICLVQNKAEATKCVACESAKPGTKAELKGFDTAAVSSAVTDPSFTFGIQTSSSESLQTLGSTGGFKLGEQGGFKFGIASEVGSSSIVTGGFKFPKTSGDFTFGVSSSDSKSEESKKDSKSNNNNFTFGLPSGTSNPSTSAFQFGTSALGQQEKDEPTLGGFSFGTSSTASLAPAENKTGASGFGFGTKEDKDVAATPFAFKKSDEKKDESPSTKGGFSFGNVESVPAPASQFVLGRTEEKPDSVTSTVPSLVFGKKVENEETKAQPMFSFGKSEQTKEESTAKPTFSFSLAKPAEKETEQTKPTFAFGAQASTADQGAAKPTFSFLSSGSSSTAVPSTSANSTSVFGSSTSASNPPPVPTPFVFGQASNTVSNSAFGSSAESTASQSFGFSQENKPATSSSTGAAVAPFVFGSGASSNNTANPGFAFGATTTSSSTGSTSSFVFGSGSSAPAAGPAFGVSQTPAFGQSQGSSQPNAPTFGSLSSTSLFSAGSQPAAPAFGSGSSSSQAPAFGQQANQQPGFGSGTPNSGSIFQFGSNPNFNFGNSNPGVFTFGANPSAPAAPAQPSGSSGFSFNQPPTFTVGSNGKNVFSASGSSVSGRKIKTAVRRRK